jgi:hypothetical protein
VVDIESAIEIVAKHSPVDADPRYPLVAIALAPGEAFGNRKESCDPLVARMGLGEGMSP